MEDKRIDRKIREIEDLFGKDPLKFNELELEAMLQKYQKEKK